MKLKVTTLNNLIEILSLMAAAFGSKELAAKHRNALETYVLNIDYENTLAFDTSFIVDGSLISGIELISSDGYALMDAEGQTLYAAEPIFLLSADGYLLAGIDGKYLCAIQEKSLMSIDGYLLTDINGLYLAMKERK